MKRQKRPRLTNDELRQVDFMLSHLSAIDKKTDIIVKGTSATLALIVGSMAYIITFAPAKEPILVIPVVVPISCVLVSLICSSLLLWPEFTQYVFFTKDDFDGIEVKYWASLRKKNRWLKMASISLVVGLVSFMAWLYLYFVMTMLR